LPLKSFAFSKLRDIKGPELIRKSMKQKLANMLKNAEEKHAGDRRKYYRENIWLIG
jgi:hypothetical protein